MKKAPGEEGGDIVNQKQVAQPILAVLFDSPLGLCSLRVLFASIPYRATEARIPAPACTNSKKCRCTVLSPVNSG